MEKYKTYAHTPPHLYRPGSKYFITSSTYNRVRLFDHRAKEKMLTSLLKSCESHGWQLEDWVILDNHYHLMLTAPKDKVNVSEFISEYHKFTALFIRKNNADTKMLPKIFNNYWDTCISYEKSYYARLNYIYYNPVKHGYVSKPEEYQWGSFYYRIRTEQAYLNKLYREFPFDDIRVKDLD